MSPAWVALGANLGDPRTTLTRALRWLDALPHTRVAATSSFHRTAPVGPAQPDFLNAVARLETRLAPLALLSALQTLEHTARRQRRVHWGPRTLDLDLLMMGYGGTTTFTHPVLTLPHPRAHERTFVLAPLVEIDPQLVLTNGLSARVQLARLSGTA